MPSYDRGDLETVAVLTEHGLSRQHVSELLRLARRLHRLAEAACLGDLTPRQEAQRAGARRRIAEIADAYGLTVSFQGDPRGHVVRVHLPSGRSNRWDNDGWGLA